MPLSEAREGLGAERAAPGANSGKTKVGEYLVADSTEALVSLAQMGIVEIHTWNSTADDIERPNRRRIPSCMCPWVGDRCVVHTARDEKGPNPVEADTTRAHRGPARQEWLGGLSYRARTERPARPGTLVATLFSYVALS